MPCHLACRIQLFAARLRAAAALPPRLGLTANRPQTYVGLLYGYLYTDGDLARVNGGQQQQPEASASSSGGGMKDLLGGRENDRPQYEEYEQGVLRDLLGVFGVMTLPPVAASPPSQRHDEHANTLRSEYKDYKAEALDAFELSVRVKGTFRRLHPAPGAADDQVPSRAANEWDKRTLAEAVQAVAGEPVAVGATVDILVSSKVDSRLARHYIQKASSGKHEGRMNLPGQARLTGRSRQRPLLSRCYCARALCMMMEADAAAAVRASRETLKRIAASGGDGAQDAMDAMSLSCYEDLGSARQLKFFAVGFPASSEQLRNDCPDGSLARLPTRYRLAEEVFVKELGLPAGSSLIDPKRTFDGDLERLCEQLDRRYEFAATRQLGVPERDHFLMGLSVGLALSWVASAVLALVTCGLAGCAALLLASRFLGENLVPLSLPAWCRRKPAEPASEADADVSGDGSAAASVQEEDEEDGPYRDRGLGALCWGKRLHATGPVSKFAYFFVPESLTDTRAMLAWVSQLLGISMGGLVAAAFAAGGSMLDTSGSFAEFAQRFVYAAV